MKTCAHCGTEMHRRIGVHLARELPSGKRTRTETLRQFENRKCCSIKCGSIYRIAEMKRKAEGDQVAPVGPAWTSTPGPRNYGGMWR